ncbi:Calcipressin, partial [Panus rudis PR-1116 ss-1]
SSSPSPQKRTKLTNTLVIAQLPAPFFDPVVLEALKDYFCSFGHIHSWAPLRSFCRIILVYYSEHDAELAKLGSDNLAIGGTGDLPETVIRVFRADPTPISPNAADNHLRPPALEKNFLISPPGSPPVGWEQIREEPPNSTPLAADLAAALRKLQLQREGHSGLEVLIEPDEEDGPGIGVYVEDVDAVNAGSEPMEEDWVYGEPSPYRSQWKPLRTAMPP